MFHHAKVFGCVLACAIAPALPNVAAAGIVTIGLKGGLAVADIQGDFVQHESRLGGSVGLFAKVGLGRVFSLRPEALLVTKGTSLGESVKTDNQGNPQGTFETLYAVDYLEIPILLGATIPTGYGLRPTLATGPALGIELRERLVTTGAAEAAVDTGLFKSTDIGWAFGAGFEMDLGRGFVSLEGRYTAGLTNLAETGLDEDLRNAAWMIMAGYSVPIGR